MHSHDDHRQILNDFANDLRAKGRSPATIESYCRDALGFMDYLSETGTPLQEVEPNTLQSYQHNLAQSDKENSIRRKVIGARQFFRFLSEQQMLADSPLDMAPIPERDDRLNRDIPMQMIERLLTTLSSQQSSLLDYRNYAIMCLLALEGVKASELISLEWSNWLRFNEYSGNLAIPGSRSRSIDLQQVTHQALNLYKHRLDELQQEQISAFASQRSQMFFGFKGRAGVRALDTLTRHGLKFLLYELGEKAKIPALNTELLRHHAVRFQLSVRQSPEEVMQHLGLRRLGNIAKHLQHFKQEENHRP